MNTFLSKLAQTPPPPLHNFTILILILAISQSPSLNFPPFSLLAPPSFLPRFSIHHTPRKIMRSTSTTNMPPELYKQRMLVQTKHVQHPY